jgi:hypothetical protein
MNPQCEPTPSGRLAAPPPFARDQSGTRRTEHCFPCRVRSCSERNPSPSFQCQVARGHISVAHRHQGRCGSIIRLPGASSERQKYLREQTESLQRRERRMCARMALASARETRLEVDTQSAHRPVPMAHRRHRDSHHRHEPRARWYGEVRPSSSAVRK